MCDSIFPGMFLPQCFSLFFRFFFFAPSLARCDGKITSDVYLPFAGYLCSCRYGCRRLEVMRICACWRGRLLCIYLPPRLPASGRQVVRSMSDSREPGLLGCEV